MSRLMFVVPIMLIAVLACSVDDTNPKNCQEQPAHEMNIKSHEGLYMHIHPSLTITAFGSPIAIPANIGLGNNYMRPIHTHDDTGKLHVEAPCIRNFTLGEFFEISGIRHDTCVMDHCGNITATVNGIAAGNYNDIVLKDGEKIEVKIT